MNKNLILTFILVISAGSIRAENLSPYAGEAYREIKSLSSDKVSALLEGKGLGYAKVAELNSYPGPAHVLELAENLKLSKKQLADTRKVFAEMNLQARKLGERLVEAEKNLDAAFRNSKIEQNDLSQRLQNIGLIEGELRAVHLAAHLKQKVILSEQQVNLYDQLRGYGVDGHRSKHSEHHSKQKDHHSKHKGHEH